MDVNVREYTTQRRDTIDDNERTNGRRKSSTIVCARREKKRSHKNYVEAKARLLIDLTFALAFRSFVSNAPIRFLCVDLTLPFAKSPFYLDAFDCLYFFFAFLTPNRCSVCSVFTNVHIRDWMPMETKQSIGAEYLQLKCRILRREWTPLKNNVENSIRVSVIGRSLIVNKSSENCTL